MTIRVPATSANMGPGFDVLGLALTLHTDVGIVGIDEPVEGAREAEDTHPAQIAFLRAGGTGRVWVKNSIPVGRGLGFSGAVRVGGIVAAEVQKQGSGWSHATSDAVRLGAELEGHADNVAPSLHGGVVIAGDTKVVRIPVAFDPVFVMWVPEFTTSTDESRGKIGPSIALTDAVFNISRTAMLVTALTTGDTSLLREATRDRIHQDIRFGASPACRVALDAGLGAGALCGWLSGSGPTVALMCDPVSARAVAAALPDDGHSKELRIDSEGARVI